MSEPEDTLATVEPTIPSPPPPSPHDMLLDNVQFQLGKLEADYDEVCRKYTKQKADFLEAIRNLRLANATVRR
jgi:hypothetical protein